MSDTPELKQCPFCGADNLGISAALEQLEAECNDLAHQLNRCNERGGKMYKMLVWAEALMRSLSGWPENHPNEFVDWKEDWRKLRDTNAPGNWRVKDQVALNGMVAAVRDMDQALNVVAQIAKQMQSIADKRENDWDMRGLALALRGTIMDMGYLYDEP